MEIVLAQLKMIYGISGTVRQFREEKLMRLEQRLKMYSLDDLKRAAAKGEMLRDMTTQESVVFHTYRYCYRTYKNNPTERTKQRLADFVKPFAARCLVKEG